MSLSKGASRPTREISTLPEADSMRRVQADSAPVLQTLGISKAFPGVQALKAVDFSVRPGEVHGLCGENGAGKSTLMKILAGNMRPDSGEIRHKNDPIRLSGPIDAKRRGILLIHQEISLVPELTVAENIFLGSLPTRRFGWFDRKSLYKRTDELLRETGYKIAASDSVADLSIAQQQMVEITRASAFSCSVVIFDEPTATLSDAECEILFRNIERLRNQGVGVVYISHKMQELFHLADRITVLRDGETRGTLDVASTTQAQVAQLMIGRSLDGYFARPKRKFGDEVLRVRDLKVAGRVRDAHLSIRQGEVVGLYGLVGAGRSELAEALFGLRSGTSGEIFWRGTRRNIASPQQAVALGIGLVPEDRKKQGLVLEMSVRGNLGLAVLRQLSRAGFVRPSLERHLYETYADRLRIRAASPDVQVKTLSGGNQQKVVLAKWLAIRPVLLILDEPTRGIDVGAKTEVHALITALAEQGMAILLISSDMPEVMHLSHRILTMCQGTMTGDFDSETTTEDQLLERVMHVSATEGSP